MSYLTFKKWIMSLKISWEVNSIELYLFLYFKKVVILGSKLKEYATPSMERDTNYQIGEMIT